MQSFAWERDALASVPSNVTSEGRAFPFGASNHRALSSATAQMRGHGGSMPRMGMRGPPMSHSMGRMPMHRAPMQNSASGLRDRSFNDRREDRREARRFFPNRFVRNRSNFVFIGDFGFPWWWGWGPWWG